MSVAISLCVALPTIAQDRPQQVEVYQSVGSWSRQLHEMAKGSVNIPKAAQTVFLGRIPFTGEDVERSDVAAQTVPLPYQTLTQTGLGFEGLGAGFPGFTIQYAPPDTIGAPGTTQYVQWVNASFVILDKATGQVVTDDHGVPNGGPFSGKTLWQGFGGGCETNNDGDPVVQFDKPAKRWVFTQFSVSTKPYLQCFAISQTDDARGPYFRFAFSFGSNDFPDYPKLGIMPNGYYMSFNIFRNGFLFTGPRACAIDRAKALAGVAPIMVCFSPGSRYGSMLPADLDGTTLPSDTTQNFFIAYGSNVLQVWKLKPNYTTPSNSTFTGPTNVAVAAFTRACGGGTCIPQPGTAQQLDSLADRLMYRLAYRNNYRNNSSTESMVVNHAVQSGSAASAIRWYELRVSNGNVFVYQQGTFAPADGVSRWMGSIAMNQCGDIALGYSVSAVNTYPSIRATGRLASDPLGTMQTETELQTGTGSQTQTLSRWGDYAAMNVDPVDDLTFWLTTEYIQTNGTFNWHTRIVPMKFSSCQ